MKSKKNERSSHTGLFATIVIALVVAIGVGVVMAYEKLMVIYHEQCVITDMSAQVEITSGKMVHPSTIAEELGLRVGANLALIDFTEKRKQLLAKIPNLREVRITRRLPNRVVITAEERVPVARMELRGKNSVSGRVVDTEGMVFVWQRGTQALPAIRETLPPGTAAGQRIKGRTLAALRLVEACREPEFRDLNILEVDIAKPYFLVATMSTYSKVKIVWEGMDEQTPAAHADLVRKLGLLRKAIQSKAAPDAIIWNATMPDTVTGDTQRKL